MTSKIVVLVLNQLKDAFNDLVSMSETYSKGVLPTSFPGSLSSTSLVFLPTTREVEERAWEQSWSFTNYFMTQKITSL